MMGSANDVRAAGPCDGCHAAPHTMSSRIHATPPACRAFPAARGLSVSPSLFRACIVHVSPHRHVAMSTDPDSRPSSTALVLTSKRAAELMIERVRQKFAHDGHQRMADLVASLERLQWPDGAMFESTAHTFRVNLSAGLHATVVADSASESAAFSVSSNSGDVHDCSNDLNATEVTKWFRQFIADHSEPEEERTPVFVRHDVMT